MSNYTRSILISAILLMLVARMSFLAPLVFFLWVGAEVFLFCKRFGKRGYIAYALLSVAVLAFLSFQGFVLRNNLQIIAKVKTDYDCYAAMSGRLLPGYVDYISLGAGVDDEQLAEILALEGLTKIESIVARDCGITDVGLLMLHELKSLKYLQLKGTPVTETGVIQLEQALPDCQVVVFY